MVGPEYPGEGAVNIIMTAGFTTTQCVANIWRVSGDWVALQIIKSRGSTQISVCADNPRKGNQEKILGKNCPQQKRTPNEVQSPFLLIVLS